MLVSKAVNAASCISSKSDFSKCTCAFCNSFSSHVAVEPRDAVILRSRLWFNPIFICFTRTVSFFPHALESLLLLNHWPWNRLDDDSPIQILWCGDKLPLELSNEPHFDYIREAKQIIADFKKCINMKSYLRYMK